MQTERMEKENQRGKKDDGKKEEKSDTVKKNKR